VNNNPNGNQYIQLGQAEYMDPNARWDGYMRLGSSRPDLPNVPVIAEYFQLVNAIFGTYLDMTTAINDYLTHFEHQQEQVAKENKTSVEKMDELFAAYKPNGPYPHNPHSRPIHMCSQGEYKERNALGGRNQRIAGNMCLVLIYQYWEDHYRQKIADLAGIKDKDEIKLDIMGDLAYLRNSIIHNNGFASKNKKCKILDWFEVGDEINIDLEMFDVLVYHVERGLSLLSKDLKFKLHS
jgi:hypothetical protein